MQRKWIYAAAYGAAVLIGWAGSAIATSCAFPMVGQEATLELVAVEVDGEPVDGFEAYALDAGQYELSTSSLSGVSLTFVSDDVEYYQGFHEEGRE